MSCTTAPRGRPWMRRTLILFTIVSLLSVSTPAASAQERIDLRDFYPNVEMVRSGSYIEGFNYVSGTPQRSVLWFELLSRGRWRQYNWSPTDARSTCHWDQFRWRNNDLRYQITHDECGDVERETRYSPAIRLMPRRWTEGTTWQRSGTSDVTHREDGQVVCRGETDWEATVLGWVEIHPGVEAIQVRSRQTTEWTEGRSESGCSAGFTTRWEENYFLVPDLPVDGGGTAPAFKRSVGGNLDGGPDQWDVWFDRWARLPD